MARAWLARPGVAWLAVAAALALPAALTWTLPPALLDWQPARAAAEPWRAVSAAWVHWSARHLALNLLAAVVVAAFGHAARLPPAAALAWLLSWPATHLMLALRPELAHYGGLSGVLHGGVAVGCAWLLAAGRGHRRALGAAVATGLAVKLVGEAPWGEVLRHGEGWDIAVAPLAHATGVAAALLAAALVAAATAALTAATRARTAVAAPLAPHRRPVDWPRRPAPGRDTDTRTGGTR